MVIKPPVGDGYDKVAFAPNLGAEITKEFGADALARMNNPGINFNAGISILNLDSLVPGRSRAELFEVH